MHSTPDFSLEVDGITGICPAAEKWAEQQIAESRIPVFSCEGPCIRGDIARLAANRVAKEGRYARCCHAETFFVPHSGMLRWVKGADKVIVIDGCFLTCHGRALRNIVGEEKVIQFDAFALYKKYADVFLMDDVPEAERQEVAEQVADKVLTTLAEAAPSSAQASAG